MLLSGYVAVLVFGVGGVVVLAHSDVAAEPAGTITVDPRVALPQRAPRDYLPQRMPIDDGRAPPELRLEIVRGQLRATTEAARARAARREAVRLRAIELTVAPALAPGTRVQATLSYYYCTAGASGRRVGDGGGFCGQMRNGARVQSGAAACALRYLGQRFRIDGDPTGRTYTCEDTGSAVHGMHRDIWFHTADAGRDWAAVVGQRAVIEILP